MFFLYVLSGVLAGILGGMGMGGGTILIPMLTIFFSVEQHVAQAINLISFIPMSIVALIMHLKNRLVEFKCAKLIIVVGVTFSLLGAYLSKMIKGELLRRFFGFFLIALAIVQVVIELKREKNNKNIVQNAQNKKNK